jgi:4-nitrophenyl phosphatase
MSKFSRIRTVLCDLDGVVWLAHQPIAGSVDAIARIRANGRRVLFVTNNSASTIASLEQALHQIGIPAQGDVVSSSMAAARMIEAGERVLVTGGPGIAEAVEQQRATVVLNTGTEVDDRVDAVIVGLHREFDYPRLAVAATAVRAGARLIGTNGDSTYPTADGPAPGGGAILAAVEAASGAIPQLAGKPHRPMATLIGEILSSVDQPFDPNCVLMVGDRPETDGLFAAELQCAFVLVRSGVVAPDQAVDSGIDIAVDLPDLAALASGLAEAV